ncbi:hypothetical protein [Paenibacillus odorifer]|uniref:hypothetical protein n=1 Tax=Paenibacillus odorifer TaxID=189426 RepID=UPI0015C2D8CD|nr:hypothetical protein [Paenibacillus odorifer]
MLVTSKSADPAFNFLAHKLRLMLIRWQIQNGRLLVDEPEAVVWWLDREIAEMEAEQ